MHKIVFQASEPNGIVKLAANIIKREIAGVTYQDIPVDRDHSGSVLSMILFDSPDPDNANERSLLAKIGRTIDYVFECADDDTCVMVKMLY